MGDWYVGVVGTFYDMPAALLKRAAFLFDEIAYFDDPDHTYSQLVRLERIARTLPYSRGYSKWIPRDVSDKLFGEYLDMKRAGSLNLDKEIDFQHDMLARAQALAWRDEVSPGSVVVPILRQQTLPELSEQQRKALVVRVVFSNLPLPSEDTSWRVISEWREDTEARARLRRLRTWVAETARSECLQPNEIDDKIGTLLDDYTTYMRAHHRNVARGRWQVLITTTAEVAEDIARVRLSSAVERLLALFREQTSLLEAELNAPGRELAYIATARGRFTHTER